MTGPKILIVEDDETLGMALEDALKQDGYRVSLEKDGAKALARVLKDRFDLVLPRPHAAPRGRLHDLPPHARGRATARRCSC